MSTAFDAHIKSILQPLSASTDGVHVDPVLAAVHANDRHTLRILIRAGYSLHTIDLASGRSLLHVATHLGHTAVAKRLLKEGIDPSLSDRDGKTSLHLAATRGFSRLLTLLLHYETHVEYTDKDNNTPLHLSCQFGHNECCRLLIYAGANLDSTNRDGDTPLHSAVRFKHAGCTAILIHAGASIHSRNTRQESPAELAQRLGHRKISQTILPSLSFSPSSMNNPSDLASNLKPMITLNDFESQWRLFHLMIQTRMLTNQHQVDEQIESLREIMEKNQMKQAIIHRKLQTLINLNIEQKKREHRYDTLL